MLASLHIRDFAIVRTLELELDHGFSVLTGETGAGKSILIDALALVLGGRGDASVIRHGCKQTDITARFALAPKSEAAKWLKRNELDADGECLLRRVIESERGSKGFINGRPVPIQTLRELGEHLVDIHGQHEHQSLLKRDAQRDIVDDYAEHAEALAAMTQCYDEVHTLEGQLTAMRGRSADRGARLDLLKHQVADLAALNLKDDEISAIEEEHGRLANGAELVAGTQAAVQALYDDEETSAARVLARVRSQLQSLAQHDPALNEIAALLDDAIAPVDEAAQRMHRYLDHLDLDPKRLEWLDARLSAIHDMARKFRARAEELPPLRQRLEQELGEIEHLDENLEQLAQQAAAARANYFKAAEVVTRGRKNAAKKLSKAVTERMQELGLAGGRFEIEITALPGNDIGPNGVERVEFLVTANAGQPARPLAKVASGGELSRISLALQVVTAQIGRVPTLIFDEVDVGVGGRVAEIVGQQLRALGSARQALCITHLAQVAALGQHHYQVTKRTESGATISDVKRLSDADRVLEIARMLGGVEISKKTIAHAEDMLGRTA